MRRAIALLVLACLILVAALSLAGLPELMGIWGREVREVPPVADGRALDLGRILLALTALGVIAYWLDRRRRDD